jgi:hypothetical protein
VILEGDSDAKENHSPTLSRVDHIIFTNTCRGAGYFVISLYHHHHRRRRCHTTGLQLASSVCKHSVLKFLVTFAKLRDVTISSFMSAANPSAWKTQLHVDGFL